MKAAKETVARPIAKTLMGARLEATLSSHGRMSNADAKAFSRLYQSTSGRLGRSPSNQEIVDILRDDAHSLHRLLPWDDRKAAEAYRRQVVGMIIRCVVIDFADGKAPVRALLRVVDGSGHAGAVPLATVMASPSYREQILTEARRSAESFRARYERTAEILGSAPLREVVDAIRRALETGWE